MSDIEKILPNFLVVTGALTVSLILLAVIPYLADLSLQGEELDEMVVHVMLALSGSTLLIGYAMKGFLLRMVSQGLSSKATVDQYLGKYFVAHIVSLAVREAGVIIAFVVSFLTGEPSWVAGAAAIGVVLNLSDLPTKGRLEAFIPSHVLMQAGDR